MVRIVRFLGMTFDERLTWAPHLRSLRLAYQIPLDVFRHSSHSSWGSDKTTLFRLYLLLVRSKLDYGAHAYCAVSPRTLRILDLIMWNLILCP